MTTALHEAGFIMTDTDPDYVVVGETRSYSFDAITKAIRLIGKGARFIATNPDATGPSAEGPLPATGAITAMITQGHRQGSVRGRQAEPDDVPLGDEPDRRPLREHGDDRRPDGHRHRRRASRPACTPSWCSPASATRPRSSATRSGPDEILKGVYELVTSTPVESDL